MLAATVTSFDADDPLAGLTVGDVPDAAPPAHHPDWVVVDVEAAALNHHDLWSLRGVGLRGEQLPMVLGTDAAGRTPDGTPVLVHGVIGRLGGTRPAPDVPTADEARSLLSEHYPGTLAERVAVPAANLVTRPDWLGAVEAACLPTAWLTAYTMLFRAGAVRAGDRVLVQGSGGGVASAAIALGAAAGVEVWVTGRDADRRAAAVARGAAGAVEPGARLPVQVDVVLETVGEATWQHSLRAVRPGGTIVVAGATTGDAAPAGLQRIFFNELRVQGVTMGSAADLGGLVDLLGSTGVRPVVDATFPLARARDAMARLASGEHVGKIVVTT